MLLDRIGIHNLHKNLIYPRLQKEVTGMVVITSNRCVIETIHFVSYFYELVEELPILKQG